MQHTRTHSTSGLPVTCLILIHNLTCVAVGKRSAGSADYLVFEHSLPTKLYVTFFPDLHNSQKSFNLVEWGFVLFALMKISRISQLKIVEAMSESISGFPWWGSEGKEPACSAGDLGSIPGLGRFPGNSNSLQYSCLENPMDRGAWWASPWGHIE